MADHQRSSLRVAVAIASAGRPHVLNATVRAFRAQSRAPDAIVVCAPSESDVEGVEASALGVEILLGARGSCIQRNRIIEHKTDFDVLIFSDDDFIPRFDYVEKTAHVFSTCPDVMLVTGCLIADGILGPGLGIDEAHAILAANPGAREAGQVREIYSGYGCNMAVRMSPVRAYGISFDENLPLYGWLEDVDFSRQLARHGRVVECSAARGVHLGVKSGRQSGVRVGYSQIANPIYLLRKGTCSWRKSLFLMSRNIVANLVGCLHPEPFIDRAGRATGNGRALLDLVYGRLSPSRVLTL